jgi:tRNA 2-selenouridine synthase
MHKEINIKAFLKKSGGIPVLDVRTPEEFRQGHITGAINLPLFDTDERAIIGRFYKEQGRDAAIIKGFELCSGKTGKFVSTGRAIAKDNSLLLHCWRGGFRSASLAWLFETAGIKTCVLKGGYKTYRGHVLNWLKRPFNLIVLGGMTGSGKTDILLHLKETGFQILDLESLAHHKGSAFGSLGEEAQKSNEQFENDIFGFLAECNPDQPVWVEDESQNIGRNLIPFAFFRQILTSPLICIETDIQTRLDRLVRDYAEFPVDSLSMCIKRISKRLGGLKTKAALEYLEERNFRKVAGIMLDYYDKTYSYSLRKRDIRKVHTVNICSLDLPDAAERISRMAASLGLINQN